MSSARRSTPPKRAFEAEVHRMGSVVALFQVAVARHLGLNPSDLQCLDVLEWTAPITAGELADILGLTSGAVTGVLDRLERRQWIERERDPGDGRRVLVRLADERHREAAPIFDGVSASIDHLATSLSNGELTTCANVLRDLNDTFAAETARIRRHGRGVARLARLE